MTNPILLPDRPGLRIDKPRMIDWGGALTPSLGGAVQTLMRLGTRHAIDLTLPLMRIEPYGRIWSAKLRLAKLYGALLPFGQDGLRVGVPGTPVVDGAGQAGSSFALRAMTPGYAVRLGQAVSLIHAGRRYLHFAADYAQAGADGRVTLPILPMLRVIPADGDAVEVAKPMMQGSLSGNEVAWTRQTAPYADFGTITVTEDA